MITTGGRLWELVASGLRRFLWWIAPVAIVVATFGTADAATEITAGQSYVLWVQSADHFQRSQLNHTYTQNCRGQPASKSRTPTRALFGFSRSSLWKTRQAQS
jgi:hypothetical protein